MNKLSKYTNYKRNNYLSYFYFDRRLSDSIWGEELYLLSDYLGGDGMVQATFVDTFRIIRKFSLIRFKFYDNNFGYNSRRQPLKAESENPINHHHDKYIQLLSKFIERYNRK